MLFIRDNHYLFFLKLEMLTAEQYKAIKEAEKNNKLTKIKDNEYRYGKYYISSWNDPFIVFDDEFSLDNLCFKKGYVRMIKNVDDGETQALNHESGERLYDYVPDEIGFYGMNLTDDVIESHIDEIIEWAKKMEAESDF